MGILSDFLVSPVGEVGYGAMAETLERANKKADDQVVLFRGLGTDLRAEVMQVTIIQIGRIYQIMN